MQLSLRRAGTRTLQAVPFCPETGVWHPILGLARLLLLGEVLKKRKESQT
jgi:hypothetical protein